MGRTSDASTFLCYPSPVAAAVAGKSNRVSTRRREQALCADPFGVSLTCVHQPTNFQYVSFLVTNPSRNSQRSQPKYSNGCPPTGVPRTTHSETALLGLQIQCRI